MAKDPAFLFYSGDFLTGTQFFTNEQVGKYIRLMCAQHLHGHLPLKHMLMICITQDEDIFEKFVQDASGLYYNEVLEGHINKRKAFTESRAKNRAGATKQSEGQFITVSEFISALPEEKEKPIIICETHVERMENENENEIINKKETEKLTEEAQNFKIDVWVYHDDYDEKMLTKFFLYWSEVFVKGKNKGKMKWQGEPTWELGKRLAFWNSRNFDKGKDTGSVGPGSKKPVFTPNGGVSKVDAAKASHENYLKKYEQGTDSN